MNELFFALQSMARCLKAAQELNMADTGESERALKGTVTVWSPWFSAQGIEMGESGEEKKMKGGGGGGGEETIKMLMTEGLRGMMAGENTNRKHLKEKNSQQLVSITFISVWVWEGAACKHAS